MRRGQTSLEILLVISFSLLLSMMIAIPYIGNQARTDVGVQAKLALLPYIEKNSQLVRIQSIVVEVEDEDASVTARTTGTLDSISSDDCAAILSRLDPTGFYDSISFKWIHDEVETPPVCNV